MNRSTRRFSPIITLFGCASLALGQSPATAPALEGVVQAETAIVIASPVDDVLVETPKDEGAHVKKGDVLAKFRDGEQKLELARCEQLLRKAEFDANATRDLARQKIVPADKALEKEVEMELARIQRDLAELRYSDRTLRSPIDGVVSRRHKEAGEAAARLDDLFELVSTDRLIVLAHLREADYPSVREGAPAQIKIPTLPAPNEFKGTVILRDPVIDAGSGMFRIKLRVEHSEERIRPGMRAEIMIPPESRAPAE